MHYVEDPEEFTLRVTCLSAEEITQVMRGTLQAGVEEIDSLQSPVTQLENEIEMCERC